MKEYAAAAHKLSLSLLAILFLSWQIAQIHASRVRMLNDAKELLTIEVWLRQGAIPPLPQCGTPESAGKECMAGVRHAIQRREANPLASSVCDPNPSMLDYLADGFPGGFQLALLPVEGQLPQIRWPNGSSLCAMWPIVQPLAIRDESFGRLALYRINIPCFAPMTCSSASAYLAAGHDPDYGTWITGLFSPFDPTIKPETNRLIRTLGIDSRLEGAARIEAIQSKLFAQKIKIPFLDEVSVRTESAVWVLAFGAFFVLVSMRNQLRLALSSPTPGHDMPWILLDAETGTERLIAAGWWFLLLISGAVTTFAVLLSAADSTQAAAAAPPIAIAFVEFAAALALGAGNVWASFECAGYLLSLRRLRRRYRDKLSEPVPAYRVEA